ncbi:MAG: YggS family pyridoxal phosphate-dependent enzyme [Chitinophagaceae bacterium]|nr:YggS family pyridoxal phosphate-dependent enzyme [Chitinophagaceae bacterium]
MPVNREAYQQIIKELEPTKATLVAVSKTKPVEEIRELYDLGQRDFGENYVQELAEKAEQLPKDIRWHFIGHLQSNKVKHIAPFIHLIHGVDSNKLLEEIDKQAIKNNRVIDCLLQVYIAKEETKFGFEESELANVVVYDSPNISIKGLMGMASFTEDMEKVRQEFRSLKEIYDRHAVLTANSTHKSAKFTTLSMGMSSDYRVALEEGSGMVRIGSLLFGAR